MVKYKGILKVGDIFQHTKGEIIIVTELNRNTTWDVTYKYNGEEVTTPAYDLEKLLRNKKWSKL